MDEKTYCCIFMVDVEGETPQEAAEKADAMVRDMSTDAWEEGRFWNVIAHDNRKHAKLFKFTAKHTKQVQVID